MYWELTFPTGNPKMFANKTVSIGLPIRRIFGDMLQFKLFICINLVLSGLNSTLYSMPYWVHISNISFMAVTVGARSMTSSAYPMAPQNMIPMWQPYPELWSLHNNTSMYKRKKHYSALFYTITGSAKFRNIATPHNTKWLSGIHNTKQSCYNWTHISW